MKTLKIVCYLMVLILLAGFTGCQKYINKMRGCNMRVMKTFEIKADELDAKYFSYGNNGEYEWQVEVDTICPKIHIPEVKIVWQADDYLIVQLSAITGTVKSGMSSFPMSETSQRILTSYEYTLTATDLGIKQWFEEDEPGWAYVKLHISFTPQGSVAADMAFLKANWVKCIITVDYYDVEFDE